MEFCAAEPDEDTRRSLTESSRTCAAASTSTQRRSRGQGIYGPTRYACTEHRIALRDFVRKHYGTLGWHPHARVLGDVPPQVRDELAGAVTNKRATPRQRRLKRSGPGFPGLV